MNGHVHHLADLPPEPSRSGRFAGLLATAKKYRASVEADRRSPALPFGRRVAASPSDDGEGVRERQN